MRLGVRETGEPVEMEIRGRNVLFAGDPRSGKTWLVGSLCERLILKRYAICIVDPEGDYACLEALPGVIVHRAQRQADPLSGLEQILRQPTLSVVLDLSLLATEAKRAAVRGLLRRVDALRRTLGVPHRVVLDEAHYFLHHDDEHAGTRAVRHLHDGPTFGDYRVEKVACRKQSVDVPQRASGDEHGQHAGVARLSDCVSNVAVESAVDGESVIEVDRQHSELHVRPSRGCGNAARRRPIDAA